MARRATLLILIAALVGAGWFLVMPEGRQLIDRARIKLTREGHQTRFLAGETLPGTPDLAHLDERLATNGVVLGAPIYIRIFKLESVLELWVKKDDRFIRFATYPICFWSGKLGPKKKEGDQQAPEGFYTVSREQLIPRSRNHRALDLGYPNVFDTAYDSTGSALQIHGGCYSVGCYAMTNPVIDEIWRFVTAALDNGQQRIPVQAFPFRMTDFNVSLRRGYQWESFWADLKKGHDLFERDRVPPMVSVCKRRYAFETGTSEAIAAPVKERCPPEIASGTHGAGELQGRHQ